MPADGCSERGAAQRRRFVLSIAVMGRGSPALPGTERRGFRRIVVLLVSLVTVPTFVLLVVGILMLVFYRAEIDLVLGVLVVTLVGCLVTGTVLALVLLRREALLSKLQSDFVAKVSHELRTPLTSIRMFVETLQMKQVTNPEEVDACLEVLARETSRLTERIERLLDWGRMEAGKRVYERRVERADEIVAVAVEAFHAATVGRRIDVHVDVSPELPRLVADRSALVEALVNLLSNAYKYTGDEKRIAVKVRSDDRWVRLRVEDNGVGIPREEHRRIFEKFYRVDERLERAAQGSGLGLAIVRHVARGHGGRIEVESEPGQGSAFTLVLPAVARALPEASPADEAAATG
jgi:two-component system phosphate regulon sensor histidine kinase PhoR